MLLGTKEKRLFTKEYLPGYTGHVPTKNDQFGMTAGDINRQIVVNGGHVGYLTPVGSTYAHRFYKQSNTPSNKANKDIFGNWSKYARNWVAGPTHEVCMQHVPGYTGHVPGINSENIFSKSYAKCTATAIGHRNPKGHDVQPKIRYTSTTKQEYNPKNFRRFIENPEMKPQKDYQDYTKFVNDEFSHHKQSILTKSNGFRDSNFAQTLNTIRTENKQAKTFRSSTANPSFRGSMNNDQLQGLVTGNLNTINDFKPKLLEMNVANNDAFFRMSDGFKKIFANDKTDQRLVIPICGYGGHRRGDRSQNFFGKSFRDITIQSKRLERSLNSRRGER